MNIFQSLTLLAVLSKIIVPLLILPLTLFLSGKLGLGGERGIQPETRGALESIQDALERFGSSMDRVLKCTVFLADMAEWSAMNEVYMEFFPEDKPARTAAGASGLSGNGRVESECVAAA